MKALALLSGGLDSTLAVRLILDQGIEVEALRFTSPFCQCDHGGKCFSAEAARELNIPLKTMHKGAEYLEIVKHPKHGYGRGINPCIDCRIFMLKKAKEYAESTGARFVFTGEVLGQRPMSQHRRALEIIEKESGLEGKLLRPLSAKHLPETEAEKKGWIDRSRLLDIAGRSRKLQFEMAKSFNINSFSCPAGGCLLTDSEGLYSSFGHARHEVEGRGLAKGNLIQRNAHRTQSRESGHSGLARVREAVKSLIVQWIPPARICHPYPLTRFDAITQGKSPVR